MSDVERIDSDGLDPDIRRFVTALQRGYQQYADFDALPLPERRQAAEQVRAPWQAGGPRMWRSVNTTIDGIRGRIIYRWRRQRSVSCFIFMAAGGPCSASIRTIG